MQLELLQKKICHQLHLVFRYQLVAPLLHGAPPAASRRSVCRHRGHQGQDLQLVLVLDNQQTWAMVKFYQRFKHQEYMVHRRHQMAYHTVVDEPFHHTAQRKIESSKALTDILDWTRQFCSQSTHCDWDQLISLIS